MKMRDMLKIIAFGAHPDDLELSVFGTLIKYREGGHYVHTVIATDGRRGGNKLKEKVSWQDIAAIRQKEARAAAAYLGIEPVFLGFEDGRLIYDRESYEKVIEIIDKIKPDLIFTHDLFDYHPDHRTIGRLALDAAGTAPVFFMDTGRGEENASPKADSLVRR